MRSVQKSQRRPSRKRNPHRKPAGNIVFFCVAIGWLILILVGLAFWFHLSFFSNQLLQNSSEKVALYAAQKLNENNHAGKLNTLIAGSRELVFTSRRLHSRTENEPDIAECERLAAQVLEQSRFGASTVSEERKRFTASTVQALRQVMYSQGLPFGREVALFSASADQPKIVNLSVGSLDNMDSNIQPSAGVPDLIAYDDSKHFLKHGKKIDFYRAGDSLKLPAPDDDLNFLLSPLPMAFDGTTSSLRLVSESHFKPSLVLVDDGKDMDGDSKLMPSCVQVMMTVNIKSKVSRHLQSGTRTLCTACTNGAFQESR